ncbi:MAG: hypothetical protein KIT09_12925 [Bryobacteraceae bacterium]|nr:hypothetical protein [Bryobacteraceae bacterium]
MSTSVRAYIGCILTAGAAAGGIALYSWSCPAPARFAVYLGLVALASLVRLGLPQITGTFSLNSAFLVVGITTFTLPEMVVTACLAALLQQVVRARRPPTVIQALFNVANEAVSVAVCAWVFARLLNAGLPVLPMLALVAAVYFVINTVIVSGVLSMLQGVALAEVCRQWYVWSFPCYLLGVALLGVLWIGGAPDSAESWLIVAPLAYLLHFFAGLAIGRGSDRAAAPEGEREIPRAAKLYIGAVTAAAITVLAVALSDFRPHEPALFLGCVGLAAIASTWKVRLPGMTSNISVNFVITLFAVAAMELPEALLIGAAGAIVQTVWGARGRPRSIQVAFNASCFVLGVAIAHLFCRTLGAMDPGRSLAVQLGVATLLLYTVNTALVTTVLALIERKSVLDTWRNCYFWSFPYYLAGATAAGLMVAVNRSFGWMPALFILPLMGLLYVSYGQHVKMSTVAVSTN